MKIYSKISNKINLINENSLHNWQLIILPKRVTVTKESSGGRNLNFHDNFNNKDMTRSEFIKEIEKGNYTKYHIRKINNIKTPVSNPDSTTNNNLD